MIFERFLSRSEFELMAVSDLKLLYWEDRRILNVFLWSVTTHWIRGVNMPYITAQLHYHICELPYTAVKCIKLKIEWETWVSWIFGETNDLCSLQWACSFKPWEILSVYLFPPAIQACMGLMDGSFSLAIHHVMSIHPREENVFTLRVLCVMELFNQGTVFCLLRNAVVDPNEFTIASTSRNLLPWLPFLFSQ